MNMVGYRRVIIFLVLVPKKFSGSGRLALAVFAYSDGDDKPLSAVSVICSVRPTNSAFSNFFVFKQPNGNSRVLFTLFTTTFSKRRTN